jgi:hypothetical protein
MKGGDVRAAIVPRTAHRLARTPTRFGYSPVRLSPKRQPRPPFGAPSRSCRRVRRRAPRAVRAERDSAHDRGVCPPRVKSSTAPLPPHHRRHTARTSRTSAAEACSRIAPSTERRPAQTRPSTLLRRIRTRPAAPPETGPPRPSAQDRSRRCARPPSPIRRARMRRQRGDKWVLITDLR